MRVGHDGANPVLSTLRYFKNEYIDHIVHKKCLAGVCNMDAVVAVSEPNSPFEVLA